MMNNVFNYVARPSRFLKSGRSLLLMLLLAVCTAAWAVPTTPTSDFIDNQDGTVTHKTTGLTWMRCAMGQTWTGSACTGTVKTYTYAQAMALTSSFAGQSDWRLPNIAELHTIVEREAFNPAINTSVFPNATSDWFWSSSPGAYYTSNAWVVSFYDGYGYGGSKGNDYAVRLVRGGQWNLGSLVTPTSHFTDHQDGTVTHKTTGLTWMRCAMGQTWTGSACTGAVNKYNYAQAMALTNSFAGQSDWRLPNENELLSIVEYGRYNPAINTTVFPNTPSDWFWSSSPHADSTSYAWIVSFSNGDGNYDYGDTGYAVRLVRGGQLIFGSLVSPDLATTLTASADRVKLKQNLTYTATVTNEGTGPATNTTLIFYFPPRWTAYISVPSDCVSNGKSYRCSVGSVAVGATVTRSITVNFAQRGTTNIVGLGITDSADANDSNNSSQVLTTITP